MTTPTLRPPPSPLPMSPEIIASTATEHRPDCDEIRTLVVNDAAAVEAGTKHLDRL